MGNTDGGNFLYRDLAGSLSSTGVISVRYGDIQWLLLSAVKQLSTFFGGLFTSFRMDRGRATGITLHDTETGAVHCL